MSRTREEALMRLAHIAKIEPGWLDGDGKAITATALAIARLLIASPPRIYPTPEGGISLEWDEADMRIGPRGGVALCLTSPPTPDICAVAP